MEITHAIHAIGSAVISTWGLAFVLVVGIWAALTIYKFRLGRDLHN